MRDYHLGNPLLIISIYILILRSTSSSCLCVDNPIIFSWNHSVTHPLILSIANLVVSFMTWHTGTLGEVKATRRLLVWIRQSTSRLFYFLSAIFIFFSFISLWKYRTKNRASHDEINLLLLLYNITYCL